MSAIQNLAKRPVIVVTLASAFITAAVYSVALFFDLARAANVATILLSVIVGISVFFIWGQLRQQARLTRVANTQALVGLSSPFNMQLIQDRQTAELWVTGPRDYERMDEVDRYRYRMLLYWWLIFHENVFYQKQNELLDHTGHVKRGLNRARAKELVAEIDRLRADVGWQPLDMTGRWQRRSKMAR